MTALNRAWMRGVACAVGVAGLMAVPARAVAPGTAAERPPAVAADERPAARLSPSAGQDTLPDGAGMALLAGLAGWLLTRNRRGADRP